MERNRIYDSVDRYFRLSSDPENLLPSFLNVYNAKTNLRVGVLNAEDAEYKFTNTHHSYLNADQLADLIKTAKVLQADYQDIQPEPYHTGINDVEPFTQTKTK